MIFNNTVDVLDVDVYAAAGSGHVFIDLNEDELRFVEQAGRGGGANAKAHIAVLIHGRNLGNEDIEIVEFSVESRNLVEVSRAKVTEAAVYGISGARTREPRDALYLSQKIFIIKIKGIIIEHIVNLDLINLAGLGSLYNGVNNRRRCNGAGVQSQNPAGLHPLGNLFRAAKFFLINLLIIHIKASSFFAYF